MTGMDMFLLGMTAVTVISFFKKPKEYPKWRQEEAERYFNGSRGKPSEEYSGARTHGLAMVVKDGKPRFVRQSKPVLNEWD